jgi:hypothetical protein
MRSKALLLTVITSAVVAGCSGGGSHISAAAKHEQSPTPTPTPTASPTPTVPALTGDPLTGTGSGTGPVIAIKVDNAFLARPYQRGLTQAAIVYQELVEGGSTRFMAIYEGPVKGEVGPVRSARESDVDILRGLGKPVLGFSGANRGVLRIFRAAAAKGYLVDASYGQATSAYRLGEHRRDARNFFARPAKLATKGGSASKPVDIGWRFGNAPTAGVPTLTGSVAFSGQSKITIRYNARTGRYVLSQGGRVIPVSPANVVVQRVITRSSRFADVHGNVTPFTVSTGKGGVAVLHDGRMVNGTWNRTGFGPTRMLDKAGSDILLKPGPTWVFLLPRSGTISFG